MQTIGKKISNKLHVNKIYEGSYEFYRHANIYSEEFFEVYRDSKNLTYNFIAQLHCRLTSGELLNMSLEYVVSKEFIPLSVQIQRKLREQIVNEYFIYDRKQSIIHYRFSKGKKHKDLKVSTPPKFHIATSFACSSTLFIRSKKFDNNTTNTYNMIVSNNLWEYKYPLTSKKVALDAMSTVSEILNIDGNNVEAMPYRLYESTQSNKKKEFSQRNKTSLSGAVQIHMSHHLGIPYIINEDNNNTKIKIKYLQNLEKSLS
ncbi:MAG: hypothetical protein OXB84_07920 [Halobacteriovoraceae bacterium]|nr:hypothetical protein [Halobacteriovoraceae bacterium]